MKIFFENHLFVKIFSQKDLYVKIIFFSFRSKIFSQKISCIYFVKIFSQKSDFHKKWEYFHKKIYLWKFVIYCEKEKEKKFFTKLFFCENLFFFVKIFYFLWKFIYFCENIFHFKIIKIKKKKINWISKVKKSIYIRIHLYGNVMVRWW